MTLKEMRDPIRHRVGVSTALEAGIKIGDPEAFGGVGQPHPNEPKPTNIEIDETVRETIADLNIRLGFGGNERPIAIPITTAQTANGPLVIPFSTGISPRDGQINEISRVWWNDGTVNHPPLEQTSFRQLDHDSIDFMSYPPGAPLMCWISGYALNILPAPQSGTIYVYAGTALFAPMSENESIPQLPADGYPVVMDGAALRIFAYQPDNRIFQASAAIIQRRFDMGVMDLRATMTRLMGQFQPRFTAKRYQARRGIR
jgi:hypothetical protein